LASALVDLHVPDPLANAIALGLGNCREDRKDQLRNAVSGHITAQVDHV